MPQGSVLFLPHVNECLEEPSCVVAMFANSTKYGKELKSRNISKPLRRILIAFLRGLMVFNFTKYVLKTGQDRCLSSDYTVKRPPISSGRQANAPGVVDAFDT